MGIFFLSWVFRALLLVGPLVARSLGWAGTPLYLCLYEIDKMFLDVHCPFTLFMAGICLR